MFRGSSIQERPNCGHLDQGRLEEIEMPRLATLQLESLHFSRGSVRQIGVGVKSVIANIFLFPSAYVDVAVLGSMVPRLHATTSGTWDKNKQIRGRFSFPFICSRGL